MPRRPGDRDEPSGWETAAKIAIGVTAAAVGIGAIIGAMSKLSTESETQKQLHSSCTVQEPSSEDEDENDTAPTYGTAHRSSGWPVARREPSPETMTINYDNGFFESAIRNSGGIRNIHALLDDIFNRHIALKEDEFQEYYSVYETIFRRLHAMMKEVDPYFRRYSSEIKFAGSHYDGLRINKPDEIDLDIVIRLPLNMYEDPVPERSDVILEHKAPAYAQLKMGQQFQNLPFREDFDIHKTAYKWMDEKKYLSQSKFLSWFRGVVVRALNCFGKNEYGEYFTPVNVVSHTIKISGSGPAVTLIIENEKGFKLSVDLVPALKFPTERWPICRGYRKIPPNSKEEHFMVVPKESKELVNKIDKDRAWRLALHLQERELMYNTNHLRQTIRFIKKLRDSREMTHIKSYYIKTIFYLEVMQLPDSAYWQNNNTTLLTHMVKRLEEAVRAAAIPYFWNKDLNLIWDVKKSTLIGYANKLKAFARILETPSEYKEAAKYLLTSREYEDYRPKLE